MDSKTQAATAAYRGTTWRLEMKTPEDVAAMLRLHQLGWGSKSIARELGIARNTVKRYLRQGGWMPYRRPDRVRCLENLESWLREEFIRHRGNAAVVHQELSRQHGIEVTLRTVQRAVSPYRQELAAEARATVRFETRPGRQLQADFGQIQVRIGGERTRVHLAVLTLGYSRRIFVAAWPCERQAQWLQSIEQALIHFGGVPEELLLDNARALVQSHDARTREVVFHPTLAAFCRHWGMVPRACAPYRARTKGKDERAVGYVKRNGIAGHEFDSWEALEAHLAWWMREVADVRVHHTTGERPIDRFERDEQAALGSLAGRPPFLQRRTLSRRVQSDCCVEVDTNHYSVPYRLVGRQAQVEVVEDRLTIQVGGAVVAHHRVVSGARQWVIDPRHLDGVVRRRDGDEVELAARPRRRAELLRPLSVYEELAGGAL